MTCNTRIKPGPHPVVVAQADLLALDSQMNEQARLRSSGSIDDIHCEAIAKLVTERGEELCIVRSLSHEYAVIQTYSHCAMDTSVQLALGDGTSLSAQIWHVRESIVTLRIVTVKEVARSVTCRSDGIALLPRAPRITTELSVWLRISGHQHPARLCNISVGGAKVRGANLALGLKVSVLVGGLPPLAGRIRWLEQDEAGIAFYRPIPFEALASWCAASGSQLDHRGKVVPAEISS